MCYFISHFITDMAHACFIFFLFDQLKSNRELLIRTLMDNILLIKMYWWFLKICQIVKCEKLHTLYANPNYLMRNIIKNNTHVLTFTYVFQMTIIKYSCYRERNGNESRSRTETAHYLQNHVWNQASQKTDFSNTSGLRTTLLYYSLGSWNADGKKITWNNAAGGIY